MPVLPVLASVCILAVIAVVVLAMVLGWRRRQRQQAHLGPVRPLPERLGTPRYAVDDAHYVATSTTANALDRIAITPLGFRGRCVVEVHDAGIALGISGEDAFFIGLDQLETVALAQATIDRAVERDGLIAIRWNIDPEHSVETYLRVVDPSQREDLIDALNELITPVLAAQENE